MGNAGCASSLVAARIDRSQCSIRQHSELCNGYLTMMVVFSDDIFVRNVIGQIRMSTIGADALLHRLFTIAGRIDEVMNRSIEWPEDTAGHRIIYVGAIGIAVRPLVVFISYPGQVPDIAGMEENRALKVFKIAARVGCGNFQPPWSFGKLRNVWL